MSKRSSKSAQFFSERVLADVLRGNPSIDPKMQLAAKARDIRAQIASIERQLAQRPTGSSTSGLKQKRRALTKKFNAVQDELDRAHGGRGLTGLPEAPPPSQTKRRRR
ncbi:hypothetical protein [Rubrivirga sp. IMCC43871]|uniref:hypothetical protein n=1 Tax=Rubrivirga sp. IMCC43871 TaxID=3391575 RepID=UPI00398FF443